MPETGTMTGQMYESDRGIVTAKPEAYLEFALELFPGLVYEPQVAGRPSLLLRGCPNSA